MKAFRVASFLIMFIPGVLYADIAGMQGILQNWELKGRDWDAAYEYASPEGREELLKSKPDDVAMSKALWRESEKVISQPEALPAVIWLLNHSGAIGKAFEPEIQKKIVNTLIKVLKGHSSKLKGAGEVAAALTNSTDSRCRYILEQIRANNASSVDQGQAAIGLALMLREKEGMRRDDPRMNAVRLKYIREAIVKAFDAPFGGGKVSDLAQELLYEINNLHVRRKAPAFELKGDDGAVVKVPSPGKNTLLVFWSPAIPISHRFASMVQDLSTKYQDLDVVMVCPALKSREGLDVKTFFDSPKGDVLRLYRINEVPWICLLDKEGVIRLRGVPDAMFGTFFGQTMETINDPMKQGKKEAPTSASGRASTPALPVDSKVPPVVPKADQIPLPSVQQGDKSGIIPPPLKPIPLD